MSSEDFQSALKLGLRAYDVDHPDDHAYHERWLRSELSEILEKRSNVYCQTLFKVVSEDAGMVAFGGIVEMPMVDDGFELRMGTVDPAWQRKGIMKALTDFRIKLVEEHLQGRHGYILNAAVHPEMYIRDYGFRAVLKKHDSTLLVKEMNMGNTQKTGAKEMRFVKWMEHQL